MVTLLSLPNCVQCTMTKRVMKDIGVVYQEVDMSRDEAALEKARSLGHLSAPVVIAPDGRHWSGFIPEAIRSLAA